jgi:hypothetical protein
MANIPRQIGRGALALLAGFATVVVLSIGTDMILHGTGLFPAPGQGMSGALFFAALTYRTIYGVIGSYIVARMAPYRPMAHALASGAVGFVLSIVGAVATWDQGPEFGPKWYPLSLIVTALPGAWAGAKLYEIQEQRRPTAA